MRSAPMTYGEGIAISQPRIPQLFGSLAPRVVKVDGGWPGPSMDTKKSEVDAAWLLLLSDGLKVSHYLSSDDRGPAQHREVSNSPSL